MTGLPSMALVALLQVTAETVVAALPECDLCAALGITMPAQYDFKTAMGPWANGCEAHWIRVRAHPELGTGKGQRLVVAK